MSETTVTVLTPSGSGAVAVLEVRGPRAWPVVQSLFRTTAGRGLSGPPVGFAFGRFGERGADEVVLAAVGMDHFEIQCHGGPRVVSLVIEQLRTRGVSEAPAEAGNVFAVQAAGLLPLAATVRTAGILLDQVHGAYDRAVQTIAEGGPDAGVVRQRLQQNAGVGRNLIRPWTVAVAGLANAGKSSLLNALAGFARSVVSPIPGTTRDTVSVTLAFDGWPVELVDTAGLRESADAVEAEGVSRARSAVGSSDLVLWVVDASGPRPLSVREAAELLRLADDHVLVVFNKIDVGEVPSDEFPAAVRVSATTGAGLPELVKRIATTLVAEPPSPGDPVPFTPEECDRWSRP